MKRNLRGLILALAFVTVSALFAACGGSKSPKSYWATFDACGGSAVASQKISEGGKIERAIPTRDGYEFMGWYLDTQYAIKFNFDAAVNDDLTLYAKWSNDLDEIYDFAFTNQYDYKITGYHAESSAITLPSKYYNIPVVALADNVFENNTDLTSVLIPDVYTSIGQCAFQSCSSLTSIVIPQMVTSVGSNAFKDCMALRDLEILGKNVRLGNGAFYDCQNLTLIYFAETQKNYNNTYTYDSNVFHNAGVAGAGITLTLAPNVSLPTNLLSTADNAHLPRIKTVVFAEGITTVSRFTDDVLPYVERIDLPDSVTDIGNGAFGGCVNLASITFPDDITVDFSVFGDTKIATPTNVKITGYYYTGDRSIITFEIPNNVISLGVNAFYDCNALTKIVIPDGVTQIGDYAFRQCSNLTEITIPDSVTKIGDGAFADCEALTSITIPDGVTSIGRYAFYGCSNLISITLPNIIIEISDGMFYNCTSLSSINIPNCVTSIGGSAFYGCSSLTSITIPDSVTFVGDCAFYGCSGLSEIVIPINVKSMGFAAFWIYSETLKIYCERSEPVYEISSSGNYMVETNTPEKYDWQVNWKLYNTYTVVWDYQRQ